jgi:hypothetical protein
MRSAVPCNEQFLTGFKVNQKVAVRHVDLETRENGGRNKELCDHDL